MSWGSYLNFRFRSTTYYPFYPAPFQSRRLQDPLYGRLLGMHLIWKIDGKARGFANIILCGQWRRWTNSLLVLVVTSVEARQDLFELMHETESAGISIIFHGVSINLIAINFVLQDFKSIKVVAGEDPIEKARSGRRRLRLLVTFITQQTEVVASRGYGSLCSRT